MKINCWGINCKAYIEVEGPVGHDANYSCREHSGRREPRHRFQDHQFDRDIGTGTDPKFYERGGSFNRGKGKYSSSERGSTIKGGPTGKLTLKNRAEKSKEAVKGHKNEEAILKILNEDVRDGNG